MRALKVVVTWVAILSIITFGIFFGIHNNETVSVKFLSWESGSTPIWVVIFVSAILGAFATVLFCVAEMLKLISENRKLKKSLVAYKKSGASGQGSLTPGGPTSTDYDFDDEEIAASGEKNEKISNERPRINS